MNLNFDIDMSMMEWCDKIVDELDDSELSTFFNHLYVSILARRGESALHESLKQNHYITWYKTVLTNEK